MAEALLSALAANDLSAALKHLDVSCCAEDSYPRACEKRRRTADNSFSSSLSLFSHFTPCI